MFENNRSLYPSARIDNSHARNVFEEARRTELKFEMSLFHNQAETRFKMLMEQHGDSMNVDRNSAIRKVARIEMAINEKKMLLITYQLKDSAMAFVASPVDLTMNEYLEVYVHAEVDQNGSFNLLERVREENLLMAKVGKVEYFNLND